MHLFLACYQNVCPAFALLLGFSLLWPAQMDIAKSSLSLQFFLLPACPHHLAMEYGQFQGFFLTEACICINIARY